MGIRGLSSFVDSAPHLLTDLKLHDSKVIIDGNNLCHFLYHYFGVSCQCGGDYDTFANRVRYYFTTLRCARIQPYVVFDGAYDTTDVKLTTTVRRFTNRLQQARRTCMGLKERLIPILAGEVFRCVLDDMGIRHVTCDFEADAHIAALANQCCCPVMSNDSDFYIYDLKAGFILFDYLNLKLQSHSHVETKEDCDINCKEEFHYLDAQIYYIDSILRYYDIKDRTFMPLFSTLLGNDYVKTKQFEVFFSHCSPNKSTFVKKKKVVVTARHQKMANVLKWLGKMSCLKQALDSVVGHYAAEKRDHLRVVLQRGLHLYELPSADALVQYLQACVEPLSDSRLATITGKVLPSWIVSAVRAGGLNVQCVNVLVSRRVFSLAQVECLSSPSSYSVAVELRRRMYALLLSLDAADTGAHNSKQTATVTEYDRDAKNLKRSKIFLEVMQADHLKNQLLLAEVPSLSIDARLNYLLQVLSIDKGLYYALLEFAPLVLMLPCLVAVFWVTNADPAVPDVCLRSLLLCFIKLSLLDQPLKLQQTRTHTQLDESDCMKADGNLNRFIRAETFTRYDRVEITFLHSLSQYQACLHTATMLNQLLLLPFGRINPADLLNGTLYYNLCKELKSRKNPALFVDETLVRESTVQQFSSRLYRELSHYIPQGKLVEIMSGKKNNKKRQKRNEKVEKPVGQEKDEGESEGARREEGGEDSEADCEDYTLLAHCTNNSFALLDLQ